MQMSKPLKGTVPIITALAMNFCTVRWVTQCACIRSSGSVLKTSFPLLSWFLSHHDTELYSLTEAYQSLLNPSHIVISQRKSHVNMTSELATVSRRSYPRMQTRWCGSNLCLSPATCCDITASSTLRLCEHKLSLSLLTQSRNSAEGRL